MATSYDVELPGDMSATGKTDPCAKGLAKMGETATRTASTGTSSTGKKTDATEIYYTLRSITPMATGRLARAATTLTPSAGH